MSASKKVVYRDMQRRRALSRTRTVAGVDTDRPKVGRAGEMEQTTIKAGEKRVFYVWKKDAELGLGKWPAPRAAEAASAAGAAAAAAAGGRPTYAQLLAVRVPLDDDGFVVTTPEWAGRPKRANARTKTPCHAVVYSEVTDAKTRDTYHDALATMYPATGGTLQTADRLFVCWFCDGLGSQKCEVRGLSNTTLCIDHCRSWAVWDRRYGNDGWVCQPHQCHVLYEGEDVTGADWWDHVDADIEADYRSVGVDPAAAADVKAAPDPQVEQLQKQLAAAQAEAAQLRADAVARQRLPQSITDPSPGASIYGLVSELQKEIRSSNEALKVLTGKVVELSLRDTKRGPVRPESGPGSAAGAFRPSAVFAHSDMSYDAGVEADDELLIAGAAEDGDGTDTADAAKPGVGGFRRAGPVAAALTATELTTLFWTDVVVRAKAECKHVGAFLRMYLTPKEHRLDGWDWCERPKMHGAAAVSVEQQKREWVDGIRQLELWLRDHVGVNPMTTELGADTLRKLALIHFSHDKQAVQLLTPNHTIGGSRAEQALRRANPLRSYTASGQGGSDMIVGAAAAVAAASAGTGPAPIAAGEFPHASDAKSVSGAKKAAAGAKPKGGGKPQPPGGGGGGASGNSD